MRWVLAALLGSAACTTASAAPPEPSLDGLTRDLIEIVDIGGLSASPVFDRIAFRTETPSIARNSYALTWHVFDRGAVRAIGSGGDVIYADPGLVQQERAIWSPDGRAVHFRALFNGAIGLWRAAADGSSMQALVQGRADIEAVRAGEDGGSILYRTGPSREQIAAAEQHEHDEGILNDATLDLAQNVFRGASINGRPMSQRLIGYWTIRRELLWQHPRQLHRLDMVTGKAEPVGTPEPVPAFEAPPPSLEVRSERGDLAAAQREGSGIEVRLANGRMIRCTAPLCTDGRVVSLLWRPGRRELLISTQDRQLRQTLSLWRPGRGNVRLLVRADGLLSGGRRADMPCALTREAAYCVAASALAPPRLERLDLDDGTRQILLDPNERLRAQVEAEERDLGWTHPSGSETAARLILPKARAGRLPLFINYYWCDGYLRGGEGDEWPIASLVKGGFAVLCINKARGRADEDVLWAYDEALAAIRNFVRSLDDEGVIDARRVGMGGFSFGSEVAMWTAMKSDLLSAVSIASTQFEPANYFSDAVRGSDRPEVIRQIWGLGDPRTTPAQWQLLSPAFNIERLRVPILFQMAEQEARMMPEIYARLTWSPTPTELYVFPGEPHIKVQPRHRFAANRRNLDWFRYWLQDFADPDPGRSEQYRRWSELRRRWKDASPALQP